MHNFIYFYMQTPLVISRVIMLVHFIGALTDVILHYSTVRKQFSIKIMARLEIMQMPAVLCGIIMTNVKQVKSFLMQLCFTPR